MKIAFFSTKSYDRTSFDEENQGRHTIHYFEAALQKDTVSLAQHFPVVCVFVNDQLTAEVIKELSAAGVSLIALRCAGFNNVDLETAQKEGIKVVRVPAYSPMAVAEHAVALILTLNRKTHKAYNRVRESNFLSDRLTGFDLFGKKVGVIGTGKIGAAFSKIMLGFGCQVLAYDIYENEELSAVGVQYCDLADLLKTSDLISLHCPLNESTHHIMGQSAFQQIKPGCMLINTSRGGLVDTKAAIEALKTGQLGYLGIDVYEQEEQLFFRDLSEQVITDDLITRLMTFPNVLITAHQGFLTKEALSSIAATTLKSIEDFAIGGDLENEVRPV